MMLNLTSLALAALVGATPAASTRATHAVVADSEVVALTDDQLTRYIATKKELVAFLDAPAQAELVKTAKATAIKHEIDLGEHAGSAPVPIYDYPKLTKQNAKLAAIFEKHHFPPEQFAPVRVSVLQALGRLAATAATENPLPEASTVTGKNIALVKPRTAELAAVKDFVANASVDKGGMGGGSDLNP